MANTRAVVVLTSPYGGSKFIYLRKNKLIHCGSRSIHPAYDPASSEAEWFAAIRKGGYKLESTEIPEDVFVKYLANVRGDKTDV